MADIVARNKSGLQLTPEEQEAYALYRENRNAMHKKWHDANTAQNPQPQKMFITDIVKKRQEGLPLTSEETDAYDEWRAKKSEYQREWRENNEGYFREYSRKRYHEKKAEMSEAVGQ